MVMLEVHGGIGDSQMSFMQTEPRELRRAKTVLISQPMKGLTTEQIQKNREAVVGKLEREGYRILDSVFDFEAEFEGNNKPLYYLAKSFELIAKEADCVYFMKGWHEARGCKMEQMACEMYGVEQKFE